MKSYKYIVRDPLGRRKEGFKQAVSSYDLLNWLREQKFTPISVNEISINAPQTQQTLHPKRVKSADLSAVCWQLRTMLEGGVPVANALGSIAEDIENPRLRQIMKDVLTRVEKGEPLSSGLSEYPNIFNKLAVAIILAGESSGNLPNSLQVLGDYFDSKDKLVRKVKGAVTYPIFVLVFIVLMVVFIMTFIIPRFKLIFEQLGGQLPAFTQAFMDVYNGICGNIGFIIGATALLAISGVLICTKTKKGHYLFSKAFLAIPLIGKVAKFAFVAMFCKTMAALLSSGVSVLEVFNILSAMNNNDIIKSAIVDTKEQIIKGSNISLSMASTGFFPNMAIKMIQVGEESGSLPTVLNKTADFYERKVDATLTTLFSLLEPIMIVTVGAIVLVVVIALYMPIFTMGKT